MLIEWQRPRCEEDRTLAGLFTLFGSTAGSICHFKVKGDEAIAYGEKRDELVRVRIQEPVFVRPAFDAERQIARMNTP